MAQKVYDFSNASEYTYDNTKIEIDSGIVKLVNYTPIDETFYANYNTNINGSRGLGVLTGTPSGGASISGGKLDLTGGTKQFVIYNAVDNADTQQQGCIRFKFTPNYITPSGESIPFVITKQYYSKENLIYYRDTGSHHRLHIYDSTGSLIVECYFDYKQWVAGQEYELEFNFNITNGEHRMFIDGVQQGSTASGTGTRDSNINSLQLGTSYKYATNANFEIDDFQVFSTVQHTSNYTPAQTPENSYSIDKPYIYPKEPWNPTSPLIILAFTETLGVNNEGSIGYQISTDAGVTWKYWDGISFVEATIEQYNDSTTINTVLENLSLNNYNDYLVMKAILISDGEQKCELDTMVIEMLKGVNNLDINVDFPRQVVLGDTIDIKCVVNESIFDWQIRAELFDNSGNSIKLANTASGGSDSQIDIVDQVNGTFFIRVAKDLTTYFDSKAKFEIEIENSAGNIFTIWKHNFKFKDEQITWTDPTA